MFLYIPYDFLLHISFPTKETVFDDIDDMVFFFCMFVEMDSLVRERRRNVFRSLSLSFALVRRERDYLSLYINERGFSHDIDDFMSYVRLDRFSHSRDVRSKRRYDVFPSLPLALVRYERERTARDLVVSFPGATGRK